MTTSAGAITWLVNNAIARWLCVPFVSPGNPATIILRSTGFTRGVIDTNDGTLRTGTTITVPDSRAGSMRGMRRCIAMIVLYSVP